MLICARGRIRILEAKIITCTCLLFLYFFPRNTAWRCTVFILCFCTRLMCRDMRSYATRGDNRAGAAGRSRALRCPPSIPVSHPHVLRTSITTATDHFPPGRDDRTCACVSVRACMFAAVSIYNCMCVCVFRRV